ncbi:MAG: Gx transporter family protein [Gemmiger sp.]|uniref:Gx transporter family protein n=1 Tax=Gemmiger sp. TaxID=2049027 RepID=UPI002E79CE81|nr:Gx transporter family protein [Gemmiger sp.]MEE0801810.1 Gx transporter family protein [Gemmiger sp.]
MRNAKTREIALTGMLFALSMALSFFESTLTPLLGLMPAMKLGLSNIVVMYAVLFLRKRSALCLVVLKAAFALLTRGVTAGFLSLCGGTLSFVIFCLLLALPFPVTGYIFSVSGALAHNIGQLMGAAVLLSSALSLAYAPILLIVGLIVGSLTYLVSHALFPAMERVFPQNATKRNFIKF